MIQLIPRVQQLVSFGNGITFWPVLGTSVLNNAHHRTPVPWPVTLRNFVLSSRDTTRTLALTMTLQKNGVATALAATLPSSSNGPVLGSIVDISLAQFDDVMWHCSTPGATGGNTFGWCIEQESAGNIFGISAHQFGAAAVGVGAIGGALGNGFWQAYSTATGPFTESTSYSICATPGSVTTLVMKTYATVPPPGASWIGYLRKNLVLQDGTGGTVDTKCEITAGNTTASATFNLPVVKGDIVEVLYYRAGLDHAFETNGQVGVGIGFVPTTAGSYMLTGGSNFSLGAASVAYVWTLTEQNLDTEPLTEAPIGPGGFVATGAYIVGDAPGDPDDLVAWRLRNSETNTDIQIGLQGANGVGLIENQFVPYHYGDTIDWQGLGAGTSPAMSRLYWGLEVGPPSGSSSSATGIIGPLVWIHLRRRVVGSPDSFTTDSYSDQDMQCPATWENGFKEGLVQRWGDFERPASHLFTGDWQGSTFHCQIAEKENHFRAQLASADDRYWLDGTVRMTTLENRADEGTAFTVFTGPIIEAQPSGRGVIDITLGDVVSQGMLSDEAQVPWRQIRDSTGLLADLTEISDNLDRDAPEPILYGELIREATEPGSPSSDDGLRVTPIYLGITNISALDWHVWLVAGHAVKDIEIYVDDVHQPAISTFLPDWHVPHHTSFQNEFGAPYLDFVDAFGNTRRYTLIYGNVGRTDPDACATGDSVLTAAVWGIEDVGDGTGNLITDRFQQYKHFLVNYVANSGPQSYLSGPWLSNPVWDLFDSQVEKVEESSFDDATLIGLSRTLTGYLGAAAIGIGPGDRASAKKWIADWNRSCGCRFIITHLGQMRIFLLHPTDALKAAAPLYTDAWEVLEDSFRTELRSDEHATAIRYIADKDPVSDQWLTSGVVEDTAASRDYGRTIPSEPREYPFAPGLQAQHLAILELRIRTHPPRYIVLDGTVGPDPVTDDSIGYLDGGDYIRYQHYDAVQETRSIRMAQVVTPRGKVGPRVLGIIAMDCEDYIDYDVDGSPGGL